MSDSKSSYSLSDKVNQIQGKIGTTNVLNNFVDNPFSSKLSAKNNKDNQNLLNVLSDLLVSLVGSQEELKKVLVKLMSDNLSQLEIKTKELIKQYALQLLSCGVNSKLNVPNGVVDQPLTYPYIDQYDFYGLFTRDINSPIEKLKYDENLNTFIKTNIDANNTTFTWKNKNNVDVVKFTYVEADEQILVGPTSPSNWGQNGIGIKEFIDLYIDSINLFPTSSILKSLLDQVFNMNNADPYAVELDFISKLLTGKCNCKSEVEDDRSKSTFDLNYYDFVPAKTSNETDETIFTNIKFGPVDAPIPQSITPKQPTLDEAYLNTVSLLTQEEFKMGNRTDKSNMVDTAINTVSQSQNTQTTQNQPIKFNLKPNLEADVNLKMLLSLPSVLAMPLFSPKITMFYGIIYKRYYITDPSKDLWKNRDEYYEFMSKLIELVIKDIMEYLLKKLFELIKKEIIKLVKKLVVKILGEKILGYVTQIKSILDLIKSLTGSIPPTIPQINFKKCSSVLDGIDSLFNIPNIPPGSTLPPGLSLMGMSKTGLSPTLMTQDAVRNMNDQGMDTKPMPDGSPNPNVVIASSMSKAVVNQLQTNARIQVSTVNAVVYGEGGGTIT